MLRFVSWVAVVAMLPACSLRPLKEWSWIDGKLSGKDIPFTCTARLQGSKVALDCDALPEGANIKVAGADHTASGKWHLDVDVGEALGATTIADFMRPGFELDPKTPLVIKISKGTVKTELPKIAIPYFGLSDGAGKPMPFGNEPAATPNPAGPTLVWLGSEKEAFGPGKTMRDVDWIAVADPNVKITDGPICKYQDRQTAKITSAPLKVHATEVVIYERRTGRVVDRNLFKPIVSCPVDKLKAQDTVSASVSQDTFKRWLKERQAKR